jgi:hypothetical protein
MRGLTRLQRRVARIVLAAAEPHGFALAGGAGLVVTGLSPRPTEDIDVFTNVDGDVRPAAKAVAAALEAEGLQVEHERTSEYFVRLMITAGTERRRRQVKIELGYDYFEWPPVTTAVGQTESPRDLAANKMQALFGRALPRDLCDFATLAAQRDLEEMLVDAKTKDAGFSRPILAEMLRGLLSVPETRWPPDANVKAVVDFGRRLAEALEASRPLHGLAPTEAVWPGWSALSVVEAQGERGEDGDDHGAGEEDPADVAGGRVTVHEVP